MSSPHELHQTATQNSGFPLGKTTPFHTKTPFFILKHPKFVCMFMYLKRQSKLYQTWNQNTIPTQIINAPFFHKTLKTTQFTPQLHNYEYPWHKSTTTTSTTKTTSFNHEFINNYNHNIILHQFEQKSTKFHITTIQTWKFNKTTCLAWISHT